MKTTPYPVRLPKRLLDLADLRAAEEQVDRSTALRQLLHAGAIGYVLELLARGRISLSKAAELLDVSPLAIIEQARERGVRLGASLDAYRAATARESPAAYRTTKGRPRSRSRREARRYSGEARRK
jgi:hypothetical protein